MFHDYIIYLLNNFNSQLLPVHLIEIKSDTSIEIICSVNLRSDEKKKKEKERKKKNANKQTLEFEASLALRNN